MSIQAYEGDDRRWRQDMAAAQAGDKTAYERLITELATVIENYLRARFGAINTLEDCVQECLIAIHRARHTYDPNHAFRPWMFTIVRHRTIDVLRKRSSHIATPPLPQEVRDEASDPEHLLRLLDGVRVLEALKPDYREAVTLTKYAGMTTAEAAAWLGISESALKSRLNRGLLSIRRHLESEAGPA